MTKKERPILPNLINDGTTEVEKFQNEVIRPIIKMQHSFLIHFFKGYLLKMKIDFINFSAEKRKSSIASLITKDLKCKNIFIGSTIGHFSLDELDFYHQNTSEVHQRIVQIIKQRLQDSSIEV